MPMRTCSTRRARCSDTSNPGKGAQMIISNSVEQNCVISLTFPGKQKAQLETEAEPREDAITAPKKDLRSFRDKFMEFWSEVASQGYNKDLLDEELLEALSSFSEELSREFICIFVDFT